MTSIYKLVAERRDRNQSIRRKRNNRNMNLFKDSIEEVQYRRPALNQNITFRQRTVSDQPPGKDLGLPSDSNIRSRRPTSDILVVNIKNQIKSVETKVDTLTKKIEELSNSVIALKTEINLK